MYFLFRGYKETIPRVLFVPVVTSCHHGEVNQALNVETGNIVLPVAKSLPPLFFSISESISRI
jgi:hypothetical protein